MRLDFSMQSLNTLLKNTLAKSSANTSHANTPTGATADSGSESTTPMIPNVKVSLSSLSLATQSTQSDDQDIEDSNLPAAIKLALRNIRMLKRLIAEKQAEIQRLQQQNPQKNRTKIEVLRQQISAFTGALAGAMTSLAKQLRREGLSKEQLLETVQLLAKPVKVKT